MRSGSSGSRRRRGIGAMPRLGRQRTAPLGTAYLASAPGMHQGDDAGNRLRSGSEGSLQVRLYLYSGSPSCKIHSVCVWRILQGGVRIIDPV